MYLLFGVAALCGAFCGLAVTFALELAVELTFPVAETVSSGFLNLSFNVVSAPVVSLGKLVLLYLHQCKSINYLKFQNYYNKLLVTQTLGTVLFRGEKVCP